MQLLVEVVVALVFVHRFVHFLGDFLVDLHHPALAVHLLDQQPQAAHQGAFVQNGLFVLKAEEEVGRDVLCKEGGVVAGGDVEHHILAQARVEGQQLIKALLHVPHQHIPLGFFFGLGGAHRGRANRGQQEAAVVVQARQLGAVLALHKDADEVVRHPHHLLDLGHDTVGVQVRSTRVLHFHLLLGDEEDIGVIAHGPLHGGDALFTAHLKMEQIVGEHHQPAQGDGGKMEHIPLHLDGHFFRHIANLPAARGNARRSKTGQLFCRVSFSGFILL